MTTIQLINNFKRDLMTRIIIELRHAKITTRYARRIAQEVLPLFQSPTVKDFSHAASKISQYYPEIRDSFMKTLKEYENETVQERLANARFFIGISDIDKALYALKGGEN